MSSDSQQWESLHRQGCFMLQKPADTAAISAALRPQGSLPALLGGISAGLRG